MSTLNLTILRNGQLVDPTSVELEDTTDTYGLKRTDTGATVVAAGTALSQVDEGVYSHTFSDPASDLTYQYVYEIVHSGTTYNHSYVAAAATNINNTVILPETATYYTSQAEVYRKLGDVAADLLEDDLSQGNREFMWQDLLEDVTSTIDLYCHDYYESTALVSSNWVRRRATTLAASQLTTRRGNPSYYADQIQLILNQLEEIRAGRLTLPGVAERGYRGPVVRNYENELWRGYHPHRVEKSLTMGDGYSGEDISWEYPVWY